MPKFRNRYGVTVSVADTVTLGKEWQPVDEVPKPARKPAKRTPRKSSK